MVWARNGAATEECPKSLVSAESIRWLEEYFVWKLADGGDVRSMPARQVDAFLVLEQELRVENNGEQRRN